jgi:hypothetical protein
MDSINNEKPRGTLDILRYTQVPIQERELAD